MTVFDEIRERMSRHTGYPGADTWITKDGRSIKIIDLDDDHLVNCLRMLRRKAVEICKVSRSLTEDHWIMVARGEFAKKKKSRNPKWCPQFRVLEREAKIRGIPWQTIPDGAKVTRTAGFH